MSEKSNPTLHQIGSERKKTFIYGRESSTGKKKLVQIFTETRVAKHQW